jgi:hypothetical protein
MIAEVPNPDARRDAATTGGAVQQNARGPQTVTTIHGIPLKDVVDEMTNAGIPQTIIRQYVNDAMAGKSVPTHTSFTAVAHRALKGQSNGKRKNAPVRSTPEAF